MTYANRNPTTGLTWEATTRGRHAIAAERLAKLQARLARLHADRDAPTDPAAAPPPAGADPPAPADPPASLAPWAFHYLDGDELLRTGEAARLLQMSTRTVLDWAQKGKLPSILTPGGHRRYRAADVKAVHAAMWDGDRP